MPPIHEKVAQLWAGKYVLALDITRQYFQIFTKHPSAQCILYRVDPRDPISALRHNGLIMGNICSSNLAGSCMIQAGSIFDDMVRQSREQKPNWDDVYPPLAAAMGDGDILDPNSLPKH